MIKKDFSDFGLSDETLKALKKLGYEKPTGVQEKVIPAALQNNDIIVKSRTGSGKTASFAIPICEKIEIETKNPQVLVLTPTRELAVQVREDFAHIGRFKRIRCAAVFGKQPMELQKRELRQRVHVVVGTPGRTFDHIERENLILDDIKYLVIDEADKMLDMGFIDQVEAIIRLLPDKRNTMLFSATMPEEIEEICSRYMVDAKKIEVVAKVPATKKIKQYCFEVEENKKQELLLKLVYTEQPESCIIFCNTREKVDGVMELMKRHRYFCEALHGGMDQTKRLHIVQSFKKGEFHFLVATDVAARGLHIDDVSHVINYDFPLENESYVHRIGRTGRVENEGVAITFVTPNGARYLDELEEYLQYTIEKRAHPTSEEVEKGRAEFEDKIKSKPKLKTNKIDRLNREITRLRINAGKKQKMRAGDILGAISNIKGASADDIGIIDVQDTCSYVEIFGRNSDLIFKALQNTKIKGKVHTVRSVRIRE